ncbi:MAG TPA: tRNA (N6-threonylcarbamoyladenosine(37)-N6)-methyltransferase TrmO [bacterium]|nr:tRNA (N6-threonylcarbamoyladenosine(37)-N6)-methyltransferase TrmO [bacterium]
MAPLAQALAPPSTHTDLIDPDALVLRRIGTIHTPFRALEGMPIQPGGARDIPGHIMLRADLEPALKDLAGFSHIELLYYFHKSSGWKPLVIPFLDDVPRGLFATRAPRRPNPIGHSIVRIDRIEGCRIDIRDVDILDGTPLLDVKPHVPRFHETGTIRCGWLETVADRCRETRSDHRFLNLSDAGRETNDGTSSEVL